MVYDSMMERALFDDQAAQYELWYQMPEGQYADILEKKLFLKLVQPKSGQSVLDIGCGTGHNLAFFKELGLKAAGIDASKPMLDIASQKLGTSAELYWGHAEELPFDNNSFDIVTLITVLEFVPDPTEVLKEAGRVARVQIYLGILNKISLLGINRRIMGKFRDSIYNRAKFYSVWEIEAMVRGAIGKVPLEWRTTLFFPLSWHKYMYWLDRLLPSVNNPFGAFLGLKLNVEGRRRNGM
jgi:ubiquinone/menaquinone biosynthesis C-methylase UbiE